MSGSWTVNNLEEVFLSHEFERSGAPPGRPEPSEGYSAVRPAFGQLQEPHQLDQA